MNKNILLRKMYQILRLEKGLSVKISPSTMALFMLFVLFSILLMRNIYSSLSALDKYSVLEKESKVLEELKQTNTRLKQEKDYYSSPYFVKLYARENLGLVQPGEVIYYIQRDRNFAYEDKFENYEPIAIVSNKSMWIDLIL